MQITDTLKHRKVELRKEGINIHILKDPIFIIDFKSRSYVPLTEARYREIMDGKARL